MTWEEVTALILSADPLARHYDNDHTPGESYTVFRETGEHSLYGDDWEQDAVITFQVDRFTKTENDPIALALKHDLKSCPDVCCVYLVDFEPDTGYIHHIYDCEVT